MADATRPPASSVRARIATTGPEVPRPPLHVLVLADLTAGAATSARQPVTKDSFPELIERLAPRLSYEVANTLGSAPARMRVELTFSTARAFEPAAVVAQVSALRELVELRRVVVEVLEGRAAIESLQALPNTPLIDRLRDHFRVRQPAATPAPSAPAAGEPAAETGLGRLFELVDVPGEKTQSDPLARAVEDFVQAVGSSGQGGRLERRRAQAGLAEIDRILSAQLDAILHAPEYARIESSWRGLRFLIDRTDFRAPVHIEVASAPLDRAPEILAAMADDCVRPSLVLADYALGPSIAHAEIAETLARAGEALQAPVVVGLDPGFLGVPSWSECRGLSPLPQLFERPVYTAWRALRGKDCAYWLALAVGRFFLRAPHDTPASADVPYHESSPGGGVWANAVWAVGAAVLRSVARGGNGLDITGAAGAGLVEDLPLYEAASRPSPLEATLSVERATECADVGLIGFGVHGGDGIFMLGAPVYRQPPHYADASASFAAVQQATLQHSLIAGRMAVFLGVVRDQLVGLSTAEVQRTLEGLLGEFLGSGSAATVRVGDDAETPGRHLLQVSARPRGVILGHPVEIHLTFTLPR